MKLGLDDVTREVSAGAEVKATAVVELVSASPAAVSSEAYCTGAVGVLLPMP